MSSHMRDDSHAQHDGAMIEHNEQMASASWAACPRAGPPHPGDRAAAALRDVGAALCAALQRTHISPDATTKSIKQGGRTHANHADGGRTDSHSEVASSHPSGCASAASASASACASGASSSLPSPHFASTQVGSEVSSVAYSHSPSQYSDRAASSLSPHALPLVDASCMLPAAPAVLPSFAAPASSPAIYRPSKARRLTLPARVSFTPAAAAGAESPALEPCMRVDGTEADDRPSSAATIDASCPAADSVRATVRSAFFAAASSSSSFAAAAVSSESSPSSVLSSLARHGAMDLSLFAQIRSTIMGFAGEDACTIEMAPSRGAGSQGAGSAPHSGVKLRTRTIRTPTKEVAGLDETAPVPASHVVHAASMDQSPHQLTHPQLQHIAAASAAACSPIASSSRHASPLPLLVLARPKRRRTASDLEAVAAEASGSGAPLPFLAALPSLIAPFSARAMASVDSVSSSSFASLRGSADQSAASGSARSERVVLRYRVRAVTPPTASAHRSSPARHDAPHSATATVTGMSFSSFVSSSSFFASAAALPSSLATASAAASSSHPMADSCSTAMTHHDAHTDAVAASTRTVIAAPPADSIRVLRQQAQFWRAEQ